MSFDASTLQMISTGTSAVGGIVGAVGALNSGSANSDSAMYQAAVARNNSTVAEQNAQYALEAGKRQESAQRQKTAQMIGAQRANMAANGIDIGSGSALNLQADSRLVGEMDALTIRNNAERQAYNYRVQAGDFTANSGLLTQQASNARRAGNTNAFTSIVGGASSVADKWLKWRNPTSSSLPPPPKDAGYEVYDYADWANV